VDAVTFDESMDFQYRPLRLGMALSLGLSALALGRFISSLLFEVSSRDFAVFSIVAVGLVGVALLACLIPARRATRVDAAEVLRGD